MPSNEKFLNNIAKLLVPDFISNILSETEFDNLVAIDNINEKCISQIENYVQEHLKHLLKDTAYEKTDPFKFAPGHRILLLRLQYS